jgi:2-keto-4-pentenoate hydratase/2-oxohepta-3-ene-1,7-dioic acid hydratase in catechol pathway
MDKIVLVGKNYLEHAQELGDAVPEKPVLFIKPPSVLRQARRSGERLSLRIPPGATEVHYECEIVVRIKNDGFCMSLEEAEEAIGELTLGLDMTLRDVQTRLKQQGHPWELSKTFLDSAVIGPWVQLKDFSRYLDEQFTMSVDGVPRQQATGKEMRLKPEECIRYASEHFPLRAGDLIFTGTPAGVGPVRAGQMAELDWGDRIRYSAKWENYSS